MGEDDVLVACRRLIAAADLREERISSALGISRSALRTVNMLEHGPRSQVDIARELGLTRAAITAVIDRLEKRGFVQRTSGASDRRVSMIELLPAAWWELAQHYRPIGDAVSATAASMSADARIRLARQLAALAEVFVDHKT